MNQLPIILGTGLFGQYEGSGFNSSKQVQPVLDTLRTYNRSRIDTARRYPAQNSGTSEQVLGGCDLTDFTIDTKVWSMPGRHQPAELQKSIDESLVSLGVSKINVLYLHFPDPETPFEDMLRGMTEIHKQGKINAFGISNFTIPQLKEILIISAAKGYIKPSVYQGSYNALSRDAENELLPLLRENKISFVAYSPAAGGAFKKDSTLMADKGPAGDLWRKQYGYPSAVAAFERVRDAAERHGTTSHALALRWVLHHSALEAEKGDAIIVGARRLEQLRPTLDMCEAGPLPDDLVQLMEDTWAAVRKDAPRYCMFA